MQSELFDPRVFKQGDNGDLQGFQGLSLKHLPGEGNVSADMGKSRMIKLQAVRAVKTRESRRQTNAIPSEPGPATHLLRSCGRGFDNGRKLTPQGGMKRLQPKLYVVKSQD